MEANLNKATIVVYDQNAQLYIAKTPATHQPHHKQMLEWINNSLEQLPQNGRILEIGSGIIRDATYMRARGYHVQTSDASISLWQELQNAGDFDAILLNALEDELPRGYDMFFANAVVPHFTPDDVRLFLSKVSLALPKEGILAFNVKKGIGDKWINEKFTQKRYSHYWLSEDILKEVEGAGFKIIYSQKSAKGDSPSHIWINITAVKK